MIAKVLGASRIDDPEGGRYVSMGGKTMIAAIYAALILMLMVAVPRDSEAEGAWVLWMEDSVLDTRVGWQGTWTIVSGFSDKYNCDTRTFSLAKRTADDMAKRPNTKVEIEGNTVWIDEAPPERVRYVCLPDTVDPRGPKGGGR